MVQRVTVSLCLNFLVENVSKMYIYVISTYDYFNKDIKSIFFCNLLIKPIL